MTRSAKLAFWLASWLVLASLVLVLMPACKCSQPPLAVLDEANGEVLRDFEAALNAWQAAPVGASFNFGDAVRTKDGATALVVFDDGARLKLEPLTTVRFVRELGNGGTATLNVESGAVVIEAAQSGINIKTELGPALVKPGSVVRAARKDSGLNLFVEVGAAQLDPAGPNVRELVAGQTIDIAIGAAVVERATTSSTPASAPTRAAATTASDIVADVLEVIATVKSDGVTLVYNGKSTPLGVGAHTVAPGSTLRLKKAAEVRLNQGGHEVTLTGTAVYTIGEGSDLVRTDNGVLTLRSDTNAGGVTIPGGWVKSIEPGGVVEVRRRGQATEVFVRVGSVQVKQGDEIATVKAGEGARLDGRSINLLGRGVGFHDLSLAAGGNLVFHNSEPPTAVGFEFGDKCPYLGVLEIVDDGAVRTWGSGNKVVNLELPTGVANYRLRCLSKDGVLGEPVASGRVSGYADSGATQLPNSAPSNVVSVDGRGYTLLYQNRLPSVTVQWPNAPPADAYTLTHSGEGGTRSFSTASPRYSFASGALGEGQHVFQFLSALGRSSRKSVATIQFDNAAPKASISSPANGAFAPNSEVDVKGIALPGWEVLAQGQYLTTDAHGRFSGRVAANERGVLFTFSNPRRGSHHYLRRAKGATP